MDIKMRINEKITTSKVLGVFDVTDESKIRIVVENANSSNTLEIKARIYNQTDFVLLKTITGNANEIVNVFTYEEIKIECTVFSSTGTEVKIVAASFNDAGGSAIDSIGVPSGDDITDIETLNLTSSDNSIGISGNNSTKTIDFTFNGGYTPSDATDWSPAPTTIPEALDQLADRTSFNKIYVYENNVSVYSNGAPGVRDTSPLIRDGWYFQNTGAGQKINWYFFDGNPLSSTYQGSIPQSDFHPFFILTLDSKNAKPIIGVYSLPTGVNDTIPGFAHSRWVYQLSTAALTPLVAGKKYLFYTTQNPSVYPELEHIQLDLIPAQSTGDKNPSELILTASLGSDSSEPVNEVQWLVESMGVWSPSVKQEMQLRIRTVPLNSSSKIDSIYLPSYVDDVVEVSSFATLPPIGEAGKIYVTLDTNKQYRWSGSTYIEVSPSEVNSVNGKVGVVVLNKSDIGLGNVDNTSDLDKPISNAVQAELNIIDGRLDSLEEINSVKKLHVFEDNLQVYADGRPGIKDPSTNIYSNGLIRDGWYFKNTIAGQKINWYFFDGTTQGTITLGNFSAYAVMTFDAITAYPILAVYTFPTGSGDIIPGFAHSRVVYANPLSPAAVAGVKYLVYFGDEPAAHPELPRIQLTKSTISSAGDQNPSEIVLTASLGSDSAEPVNEVQFMVETLGVNSPTVKQEIDLRIKPSSQSDFSSHINNFSNPHAVTKTQVGLSNVDNTSDLNKPISTATQTALNLKYDASNPAGYITSAQAPVQSVNSQTGAVNLDAADIPFTPYGTITSTEVQSAIEELDDKTSVTSDIALDTKEPTGFVDRTESTTSFDNSSRLFTIQPVTTSFSFYIKGTKFTKTTLQSITIPNLAGNHYVYFNDVGNLATTQTFTSAIIEQYAFVTVIYWNTDTNTHSYFAEERHGITMDGATHSYLHTTFGARYISGLALENFTIGDGTDDTHAQFTADLGAIRDEDLYLQLPAQSQIPILFKQGQLWRKKLADNFPLLYNDGVYYSGPRIPFNEFVAGSWQLTPVDSNKFVLVHFFATNDKETPIIGIQGTAQYNDIPAARIAAGTEISSLTGLPFAEFVAIGTVIFQTNTYTNIPDARVRAVNGANYVDFRGTQLYTPAGEATTHGLLSGLDKDDHTQYLTEARGDARYYTQTQIDAIESTLQADINTRALDSTVIKKDGSVAFTANQSMGGFRLTNVANPVGLTDAVNLQTLNASIGSSGDIVEKSFSIVESQISTSITNFIFPSASIKSFTALVSVTIDATSDLNEQFELNGIQLSSGWVVSTISRGDNTNVTFDVDSTGQVRYSSSTYSGFVSGTLKFRAFTTSI